MPIDGTLGDDILNGTAGDDVINGFGGDDYFRPSAGSDIINGGDGFDTLDFGLYGFQFNAPGLFLNLETGLITGSNYELSNINITASNIERVYGSRLNDVLIGSANNEQLFGGGGSDVINGGGGNDFLDGDTGDFGRGSDNLFSGPDTLDGGAGDDVILVGVNDTAIGGEGQDTFAIDRHFSAPTGLNLNLELVWSGGVGTNGPGTISGFERLSSFVLGTYLNDFISLGTPQVATGAFISVLGQGGDDTIIGGDNIETLRGGDGNDQLTGNAGNDFLFGQADNDTLNGGAGTDEIDGDVGNDTASYSANSGAVIIDLVGNYALETALIAGTVNFFSTVISNDTLVSIENATGSPFGDRIYATDADNILRGGDGDDFVYALDGNDILQGDAGSDFLIGGDGTDTAIYTNAIGAIFADIGHFVIETGLQTTTVSATTAAFSTDYLVGIEHLDGSAYGDRIYGNDIANIIRAGAGDDIVYGGLGDDRLIAGTGSDFLIGEGGTDLADYSAAQGAIFADLAGSVSETALTTGTVSAAIAVQSIDYLISIENLNGTAFGDRIYGSAVQNFLNGNAGNDIIYGGDGADTLDGGEGDDTLIGEQGIDVLVGRNGVDRFFVSNIDPNTGVDTISDFISATDQIWISRAALGISSSATWAFVINEINGPVTAPNTFEFNLTTRILTFDVDGPGSGAAINLVYSPAAMSIADLVLY